MEFNFEHKKDKEKDKENRENIIVAENIPLKKLTTLNIGGDAKYFIEATSEQDILDGLSFAKKKELKIFVLSGGSNILISDSGFDGLVISNSINSPIEIMPDDREEGKVSVIVSAGTEWDKFVKEMVDNNLTGVECLSGIPGKVGGAPIQNIGAYGQEVGEIIKSIRAIDRTSGEIINFQPQDCHFGYRSSIFNGLKKDHYIITSVTFSLFKDKPSSSSYPGLDSCQSLSEMRDAIIKIRHDKGMIEGDVMSVGSFFKNPIISKVEFDQLLLKMKKLQLDTSGKWYWDNPGTETVKISAARIIQESGFPKGYTAGNVGVSPFHPLALVNSNGNATASELISLARTIQEKVFDLLSVKLTSEPEVVGFADYPFVF